MEGILTSTTRHAFWIRDTRGNTSNFLGDSNKDIFDYVENEQGILEIHEKKEPLK
ncbi:MAG: hypothetical protein HFJ26_09510 [Clostridia bacterium]|nr:hypothetical protein [Clostridia bacterium]